MKCKKYILGLFSVLLIIAFFVSAFLCRQPSRPRRLLLSHSFSQSHPIHQFLVNLNRAIEEKSGGRLKLIIYDSAQLGSESQFTEQIRIGILDGGIVSNQMLSKFSPDFIYMQYPYIFMDEADTRSYLNRFAENALATSLMDSACNLTLCCSLTNGMNGFYIAGSPENFQLSSLGKRTFLACSIPPFCMKCFSDIGFLAVPVAKGEIYSALQMKMIDAGENTLPGLISSKHYETARTFVKTNHSPAVYYLVFNSNFMHSLNSKEKKWLVDACVEAKREFESMQSPDLQNLAEKNGVSILALSEEETHSLRKNAELTLEKASCSPWRSIFSSEKQRKEVHK